MPVPYEVKTALSEMKNNKAEAIMLGGNKTNQIFHGMHLPRFKVPFQWNNAVVILVQTERYITELKNYPPMTLLSQIYKLFTKRLNAKLDFYKPKEQAGFRSWYYTLMIKNLIEKLTE